MASVPGLWTIVCGQGLYTKVLKAYFADVIRDKLQCSRNLASASKPSHID